VEMQIPREHALEDTSFKMPTNPFGGANCWVEMLCAAKERGWGKEGLLT
jgi:hypothetical protein